MGEDERAFRRHLGHAVVRGGGDIAIGEQLREPGGLRRRDDAQIASCTCDLAQECVETARVRGDAAPAEPQGVGVGTDAHRAVLVGRRVETVARHVRRREDGYGETLFAQLLAPFVGLRLVRIVREPELDRVLEDDRGAVAEMVQQRGRRSERGRERVGARRDAALAQRLDQRRVRLQLVLLATRRCPTRSGETLRERGRALERVFTRGQDVDRVGGVLRALRDRIESAERLDVVAEELDAHRHVGRGGIHVEDPAAA